MAQPFVIYQNQLSPSVPYPFTVAGEPFDLTGCAVAFSMRPIGSATPTISLAAASIVGSGDAGNVSYAWASGDTAIAGMYAGWFTATPSGGVPQDAPEFVIEIAAHATAGPVALVTLEEMENHLKLGNQVRKVTESDKQELRDLILAVSNRCEEITSHRFAVETAVAKTFRYDGDVVMDMHPWDLRVLSSIQIDTDGSSLALDPAQYRLEPRNTPHGVYTHVDMEPYTPARNSNLNWWGGGNDQFIGIGTLAFGRQVTVTGDWGWTTIPYSIKQGVKVLVGRSFNNPLGAQIIKSATVELQFTRGGASGLAGKAGVGDDLPDEVASAWKPFVRAGF